VRALYRKAPTLQEAQAWGLTLEEASGPPFEVWPDLMAAVNVFGAMQTQWRTGMAGATGLDYGALPAVMRLMGVPRADWPDTFDALRVLEDEALTTFREDGDKSAAH
jgi:hypothetical protein